MGMKGFCNATSGGRRGQSARDEWGVCDWVHARLGSWAGEGVQD
jgi:hypothetical protein